VVDVYTFLFRSYLKVPGLVHQNRCPFEATTLNFFYCVLVSRPSRQCLLEFSHCSKTAKDVRDGTLRPFLCVVPRHGSFQSTNPIHTQNRTVHDTHP